jgi:hypothetical protein
MMATYGRHTYLKLTNISIYYFCKSDRFLFPSISWEKNYDRLSTGDFVNTIFFASDLNKD